MHFFSNNQRSVEASISRLGPYSGNKATFASTGTTVRGFLEPIDPDQSVVALGIEQQAYRFVVRGNEDVQINDKLTIDGTEYNVRGVQRFDLAGIDHRHFILELSVKL